MKIFVTGARGYVGTPLVHHLSENKENTIIAVDNNAREKWVENIVGYRCCNTMCLSHRDNVINIEADLSIQAKVFELMQIHQPDVIIHLASQPSQPYAHLSAERALFTQMNNVSMCLNLLFTTTCLLTKPKFIITTTTGIPGQYYKRIKEEPVINQAGSWYHVTRGFDSANCSLASRLFNLDIVEFRTSIIYGVNTFLTARDCVETRFDTDFYFGTALNRFVYQALSKQPITIYGKGEQVKPFISLEDTIKSIENSINYKFVDKHTILNQVTEHVSIKQLAELIRKQTDCKVKHIFNPRNENETHKMIFENKKFLKVLGSKPTLMKDELPRMINSLEVLKDLDDSISYS